MVRALALREDWSRHRIGEEFPKADAEIAEKVPDATVAPSLRFDFLGFRLARAVSLSPTR